MHPHRPATPEQARNAFRALFTTFSAGDRGEPAEVIATYLIAASGYPLAAIEEAVFRFIRGEVSDHDGRFLPTAAELGREIAKSAARMRPVERPRAYIAPPRYEPDDDSKARVRAVMDRLKRRWTAIDAAASPLAKTQP